MGTNGTTGVVGEAQVLRGVLRVPGDLLGEGVLRIEIEIGVEAILPDGHVLDDADAVAEAPPLARIDVVDVHAHAFVHRRGLGDDAGRVLAALLGNRAQQLDALDDAPRPIDAQAHAAVVGVFLEHVRGDCPDLCISKNGTVPFARRGDCPDLCIGTNGTVPFTRDVGQSVGRGAGGAGGEVGGGRGHGSIAFGWNW